MWFSQLSLTVYILEPSNRKTTEMRAYPSVSVYKRSRKPYKYFLICTSDLSVGSFWLPTLMYKSKEKIHKKKLRDAYPRTNLNVIKLQYWTLYQNLQRTIAFWKRRRRFEVEFSVASPLPSIQTSHFSGSLQPITALFKMVPESGSLEWKRVSWMSSSSCCN